MKTTKEIAILMVMTVIVTIIGGTFAYWNWQSTSGQRTNVTFTVASGFTCGADGGGDITSSEKMLAPAACTNPEYAIQRTVTVTTTQDQGKEIALDMWLKVNSIGSGLSGTHNFKYALTTNSSSCTTDVIAEGDFYGANTTDNSEFKLLDGKQYSQSTPQAGDVYYLYIWLDAAESSQATQDQTFNMTLEGSCTDELPEEVSAPTAAQVISAKYNGGTNNEGLILVNTNEYRYSGVSVKNYVNYNNETWRIVGIFDGRIKLMRDALLETNTVWRPNDTNGNAWEGSEIEIGLNGDYLTSTGYLGSSLNSAAQNLIDDAIWYVTPIDYNQNTANTYVAERPSIGAVTYEGVVGLINPSDYGYASSECYNTNTTISDYYIETCKTSNWMYENMLNKYWWTISPVFSYSNSAFYVGHNGYIGQNSVKGPAQVRPSVYLKSTVKLASNSGDGSSAQNAYIFELDD